MSEAMGGMEEGWRERAVNESLRAAQPTQRRSVMLAEILRAQPALSTQMLHADRDQALAFMQKSGPLRPLLPTSHGQLSGEGEDPYVAWFAVEWRGADLEVAFAPGRGAGLIVMGRDEDALREWARAMFDFALLPAGRCLRYSSGWENAPDMDEEIGKVTWGDIVLPPDVLKRLRQAIEGFFAHRDIVRDLGFAWRRGVLLVGPPGTGKTMVCKAAAAALPNLPFLYVRELGHNAIEDIFDRARKLAPCILAFEDIDGFVTPANRTVFLNEMDGFASNDGLLVIASSNHPGQIDEALLKRPSRFDRVFHLGLPAQDERRIFCERVLSGSGLAARLAPGLDAASLAERVAQKTEGFTPAYLKEAFVSAALERAQEGSGVLDGAFAQAVEEQVEELRAYLKKAKNPDALGEMRSLDDAIGFRR
jgi:hypothetical protein